MDDATVRRRYTQAAFNSALEELKAYVIVIVKETSST